MCDILHWWGIVSRSMSSRLCISPKRQLLQILLTIAGADSSEPGIENASNSFWTFV